jgi:electron transport complex protein RnfD
LYNPAPAAERLTAYTSGQMEPDRFSVSLEMVLRDQLPPLEDCLIGGEPAPMGMASALAVIVAGLFLLHRGLIDWRIPAFTLLAALAAFLILPVPVVITDMGAQWSWCAFRRDELGWPAMVTLANYELLASPLLFVTFFLATSPRSRPLSNGGRICYGLLLGFLAAGIQLYASVEVASYVALLLANLASPVLDKVFKPRPLV